MGNVFFFGGLGLSFVVAIFLVTWGVTSLSKLMTK